MHLVSPGDEAGGEAFREAGGTVHVGREGVGTDEDLQWRSHGRRRKRWFRFRVV
jgi:hypothetical protein